MKQLHNAEKNITAKIATDINLLTGEYFDLYNQEQKALDKKRTLDYQYAEYIHASTMQKNIWFFLVFVLTPLLGIFDYSTIAGFIRYLAFASGGGIISMLINIVGWALFLLLELGIGAILIYAKNKPFTKAIAIFLAVCMVAVPPFIIWTTYAITPEKTQLLLYKTIALIIVSLIIHITFFVTINEIWKGINYYVYRIKVWLLKSGFQKMKQVREKLLQLYPDFDNYTQQQTTMSSSLLHNRSWFVKHKLTEGDTTNDYDLSDYDSTINYMPYTINNNNHTTQIVQ